MNEWVNKWMGAITKHRSIPCVQSSAGGWAPGSFTDWAAWEIFPWRTGLSHFTAHLLHCQVLPGDSLSINISSMWPFWASKAAPTSWNLLCSWQPVAHGGGDLGWAWQARVCCSVSLGRGSQTLSFTESLHLTPFYPAAEDTICSINEKLEDKDPACKFQEEGSLLCNWLTWQLHQTWRYFLARWC